MRVDATVFGGWNADTDRINVPQNDVLGEKKKKKKTRMLVVERLLLSVPSWSVLVAFSMMLIMLAVFFFFFFFCEPVWPGGKVLERLVSGKTQV